MNGAEMVLAYLWEMQYSGKYKRYWDSINDDDKDDDEDDED